jgi:hypothetical protein
MEDGLRQAAVAAHGREGETRAVGALMFDIGADLILHGLARPACDLTDPATGAERIGDLRVPHRRAVTATIFVMIPAATATWVGDEPATLAGFGALDARESRRLVAHTTHWTRVITDPVDDSVLRMDSHERRIPPGLRRLTQLSNETCTGVSCGVAAHRCDLDHLQRFEHHGPTSPGNLTPLCRIDHRIKDEGYWRISRLPDGGVRWTSKWGSVRVFHPPHAVKSAAPILYENAPPF